MEKAGRSRTAEATTLFRALESRRPAGERVCFDPYAIRFLGRANIRVIMSGFIARTILGDLAKRGLASSYGGVVARTRFIDDYLQNRIEAGLEQIVILGAGYDSRAYRFPELQRARVFEVDHPITLKRKVTRVRSIFGSLPDHVTYMPVDMDGAPLDESLLTHGFRGDLQSLFILEGLSMYLPALAIDGLLAFISDNVPGGSSIVFDYVYREALEGTAEFPGAEEWLAFLRRMGEPPVFGIERDSVGAFLTDRGFTGVEEISYASLKDKYFPPHRTDLEVASYLALAHAIVE